MFAKIMRSRSTTKYAIYECEPTQVLCSQASIWFVKKAKATLRYVCAAKGLTATKVLAGSSMRSLGLRKSEEISLKPSSETTPLKPLPYRRNVIACCGCFHAPEAPLNT